MSLVCMFTGCRGAQRLVEYCCTTSCRCLEKAVQYQLIWHDLRVQLQVRVYTVLVDQPCSTICYVNALSTSSMEAISHNQRKSEEQNIAAR